MKAVIIDDDILAIELLDKLVRDYCPEFTEIRHFTEESPAIAYLTENAPDVVFLDVNMQNMSGFDMLELLPDFDALTILVSGSAEHGIEAVRHKVFDYIVKPVSPVALSAVMKRVREELTQDEDEETDTLNPGILIINRQDRLFFVPHGEIIKLLANGPYCTVQTVSEDIQASKTMLYFMKQLPRNKFVKINRSIVVNKEYFRSIRKFPDGTGELILKNGDKISLSKPIKERLIHMFSRGENGI